MRRGQSSGRPAGRAGAFAAFWMGLAAAGAAGLTAYGAGYTVYTTAIMVKGASMRVLTDGEGKTLYYTETDTPARSTCTGSCSAVWPPLLSDSAPAAEEPLPGKLALVKTANGSQVSYNGHLLYTYSLDTAPHQDNGQGIAGKWWVATVDLKPAAMGTPAAPAAPASKRDGGY